MNPNQWRLQDAKTQLSQVVEAALRGEPQHITRNGKQAVVVLSEQAFESLQRSAQVVAPGFIAHLLAMPKDRDAGDEVDTENASLTLRDIDFS
jgi:antitoxin Phd